MIGFNHIINYDYPILFFHELKLICGSKKKKLLIIKYIVLTLLIWNSKLSKHDKINRAPYTMSFEHL